MKRWMCAAGLAIVAIISFGGNARAQLGYGIGPGIGFNSGYGGFVPSYGSGISLSVGPGIGISSGYGYSLGRPYGAGYGTYRPYGGYGPIGPSPYGIGYSYIGAPVFRAPVYRYRQIGRRRF